MCPSLAPDSGVVTRRNRAGYSSLLRLALGHSLTKISMCDGYDRAASLGLIFPRCDQGHRHKPLTGIRNFYLPTTPVDNCVNNLRERHRTPLRNLGFPQIDNFLLFKILYNIIRVIRIICRIRSKLSRRLMHPSENRAVGVNKLFGCPQSAIRKGILKNSRCPCRIGTTCRSSSMSVLGERKQRESRLFALRSRRLQRRNFSSPLEIPCLRGCV